MFLFTTLNNGYTILRILSLDVVAGALVSGYMVGQLMGATLPLIWWIGLPVSVWVIYTADHLLDAWRLKDQAHTDRHLFHHKNFKPIALIWGILFLICLTWLPWKAPQPLLFLGLGMGGFVMIHLSLVKIIGNRISWMFHKELGVGFIYSAGVWGGGWVLGFPERVLFEEFLFIQFLLLALINLLAFSMYEIETDEKDGHTSFVRAIGVKNTKMIISFFALVILAIGIWVMGEGSLIEKQIEGVYICMLLVLMLTVFLNDWFSQNERYRIWGDLVFMFPVIFLF
ncbi:MAG: hypothetical protein KDE26_16390 [Bacteroidetes bacterium]|nr:hypothetical protein [Bacteroidota bacterium]